MNWNLKCNKNCVWLRISNCKSKLYEPLIPTFVCYKIIFTITKDVDPVTHAVTTHRVRHVRRAHDRARRGRGRDPDRPGPSGRPGTFAGVSAGPEPLDPHPSTYPSNVDGRS